MFEAHLIPEQDLFFRSVTLPSKSIRRTHKVHLRPVTIWFAEGKKQARGEETFKVIFLYGEYRDDQGENSFFCQSYPYPECLQQADIDRYINSALSHPLKL